MHAGSRAQPANISAKVDPYYPTDLKPVPMETVPPLSSIKPPVVKNDPPPPNPGPTAPANNQQLGTDPSTAGIQARKCRTGIPRDHQSRNIAASNTPWKM